MPRQDVEFKTHDDVILRGWFYTPSSASGKLPCLVLSHGWSALKEMDLDTFAEHFSSKLDLTCLVFDNRGFGASDTGKGQPRQEIIPSVQHSDIADAITYAQTRKEVDPKKIGIWGSSYSGGHVLAVAAIDKRVKAAIAQVPLVNGWENFHRLVRPDFVDGMNQAFEADRHGRAAGKDAILVPVVDEDPLKPSALPTPDSYQFFTAWGKKSGWKNENTIKSVEALRAYIPSFQIENIAPTPLLMVVASNDILTPTDLSLKAYARALEPKELYIIQGAGHFDGYSGPYFEQNAGRQTDFLSRTLCKKEIPHRS